VEVRAWTSPRLRLSESPVVLMEMNNEQGSAEVVWIRVIRSRETSFVVVELALVAIAIAIAMSSAMATTITACIAILCIIKEIHAAWCAVGM